MRDKFLNHMTARKGTALHQLAHDMIKLGIRPENTTKTFNQYVIDAIGFKMQPEVVLYYSDRCFGTADTISFFRNKLRIHDLKNGSNPCKVDQLLVYAALFCLEYNFKPFEIEYELRIYQNDDVQIYEVDPVDVAQIMDKIITFDKMLQEWEKEAE